MKRTVFLLVLLCLFAGTACAQEFAVGDSVSGFTAVSQSDFDLVDARVTVFVHDRTGAGVCLVENDDINRVFDTAVMTHAIDNTGLPHVFEHATLDGSRRYPSESLFFNLIYQTYNTYLNATTQTRLTNYPCASLSEEQLLRYADFYTDSILHPMVMEKESLFREEAWRYRLENKDGPLTIEGTVYSEMLGAMTLERQAMLNHTRLLFPGSAAGYNSGGDPDAIPDLTWQALIDYHERFYHPSNCMTFLYGQFEHPEAFLALLDEAYADYERREMVWADEAYVPQEGIREAEYAYPAAQGTDTKNAAAIYFSLRLPELTEDEIPAMDELISLLGDDSFPILHNLKTALPSGSFYLTLAEDGPEPALTVAGSGLERGDAVVFRDTVMESLQEMAEQGLDSEMLGRTLAALSLSVRLLRENSGIGVGLTSTMAYYYALGGNPLEYVRRVEAMDHVLEWNEDGTFKKLLQQILASPGGAMSITYPEPGGKEANDLALAERLEQVLAEMTDEEKETLIEASLRNEPGEDSQQMVKALTAVTVESLPEEIREYVIREEDSPYRKILAEASVDGVGMSRVFLREDHLDIETMRWVTLLTDLVPYLDTERHTRQEISSLMNRYFYDGSLSLSPVGIDQYVPYLSIGFTALDEDLEGSYDFAFELLTEGILSPDRLKEAVSNLRVSARQSLLSAPYSAQLLRGMARTAERYRYSAAISSYEYYAFLAETEKALSEDPDRVVGALAQAREKMLRSDGAVGIFCGSEESISRNEPLMDAFVARFPENKQEAADLSFGQFPASEGIALDISVQYNGYYADYETLGLDGYDGRLAVTASIVSDAFLYPMLRDQYGAYGVIHGANRDGMYVYSYRDPNLKETYGVYAQLPELVESLALDQGSLNGYILSAYAGYAMPQGELAGAMAAAMNVFKGAPKDENLTWMRQMKAMVPEDLPAFAGAYRNLVEKGARSTSGPASALAEAADLFDTVFVPFAGEE